MVSKESMMPQSPQPQSFAPTRWTLVQRATVTSPEGRAALSELCEAYYQPVFGFMRRIGWEADLARDHTHSFFAHLLERGFPGADPAKGRFRNYLLGAVKGKFELTLTPPNTGDWRMKIGAVLMNGAEPTITTSLRVDADQRVDVDALNLKLSVQLVESLLMQDPTLAAPFLDNVAIARMELPEARRQLKLLQQMTLPEPPLIDLTTTEEPQVYVSDAHWTHAEVGWGKVMRNRYDFSSEQLQGMLLQLNGRVFAKGLYAHAKSNYTFPLAGRWKRFESTVGLRDGNPAQGRSVFIIEGDGQELARSRFLESGAEEKLSADVSGVRTLSLRVEGADGHNHGCWSIWCDPLLTR